MPRVRINNNRHRAEKDSYCFELFLFLFFLYCMIAQWVGSCSWFFNSFVFTSYTFMIVIRRFQAATIDEIENNIKNQIILIGVMMPVFFIHTILGGQQFFKADVGKCRTVHQGEVFYIIMFMFALSMCLVFFLLFACILAPNWIKKIKHRRRTA